MQEKFTHSLPLIFFTTFLPVAIGLEIGALTAALSLDIPDLSLRLTLNWSLGLTLISACLVSLHLGHVKKGLTSLRGVYHSFLSREILLAGCFALFLLAAIGCSYRATDTPLFLILLVLAGTFGMATSYVIGKVYHLPSQLTWYGLPPSLSPLLATLLSALSITLLLTDSNSLLPTFLGIFSLILFLDAIFTIVRFRRFFLLDNKPFLLVHPRLKNLTNGCYALKLILTVCLIGFLLRQYLPLVLISISFQILLDRIAFYASTARQTPRANFAVAKHERMNAALNISSNELEEKT